MKKEERIRESKKIYEAIRIPEELPDTVRRAIQQTEEAHPVVWFPAKRYGKKWRSWLLACWFVF